MDDESGESMEPMKEARLKGLREISKQSTMLFVASVQ